MPGLFFYAAKEVETDREYPRGIREYFGRDAR
jgi:hypothetical protein